MAMPWQFQEKPDGDNAWINGGFFVLEESVLDLIAGDDSSWEGDVLPRLAASGQPCLPTSGKLAADGHPADRTRLEELGPTVRLPGNCGNSLTALQDAFSCQVLLKRALIFPSIL